MTDINSAISLTISLLCIINNQITNQQDAASMEDEAVNDLCRGKT